MLFRSIGGVQIAIIAPKENHTDCVNRRGYRSVVIEAVVDCNYLFRNVGIGWPGRAHDDRILTYSSVYGKGNNNTLFPDIKERTANQDIATVILSDPAYPLLL